MMKKTNLWVLFALFCNLLVAQTPADTTIYEVAEKLPIPMLAACQPAQHPGWTEDSIRRCAETQLLSILSRNMRYPEEARQKNIEGTVVASFIVEPTGRMSNISILKDIGSGCGDEALRVLHALDTAGLRWLPAMHQGKPVRMKQALPLRFKLQEALPYYISDAGDTIYTSVETQPDFRGGLDSLLAFVLNRLDYPARYRDSCRTGIIEMALLIRPDGRAEVDNQIDFSNLGMDFQWEALRMVNRTTGLWTPATYDGKPVTTTIPLRTLFKSDQPGCTAANEKFDQAMILADDGAELAGQNETEKALEQWNKALALLPDNTELLYYRGSALLTLNRKEEACKDFNRVKEILGTTWFEQLRRLVCGW
jgi:TonB family protein